MAVAVVMPAYQAARTIAAALASVQAQTLAPREVLFVDDGSVDETAAIVARIAAGDARVRLVRQANAGPVAARNRAIAATSAPLIAPLDADDLWHPAYLAEMVAAMAGRDRPGFAYALHHVIDGGGAILASPPTPLLDGPAYRRHLLVNVVGCGSAAVFRREALLGAGGYDERTWGWGGAEDYLLQLRIAAGWPIACVPRRLVGYRRVAGSLSDDPLRMARARIRAVAIALGEYPADGDPIRRWVAADARRTAAALIVKRGRLAAALAPALVAALADPVAALADGTQRLRNLVGRGRGRACLSYFGEGDASIEPPPALPPLLAGRLRRLAAADQRQRPR